MPISIQMHHAVGDGFHASRFFIELEKESKKLGEYLL